VADEQRARRIRPANSQVKALTTTPGFLVVHQYISLDR
jgi:hypothetical protein